MHTCMYACICIQKNEIKEKLNGAKDEWKKEWGAELVWKKGCKSIES